MKTEVLGRPQPDQAGKGLHRNAAQEYSTQSRHITVSYYGEAVQQKRLIMSSEP